MQGGYCDEKFLLLDTNRELELQVDYCCFLKEWQLALDSIIEFHTSKDWIMLREYFLCSYLWKIGILWQRCNIRFYFRTAWHTADDKQPHKTWKSNVWIFQQCGRMTHNCKCHDINLWLRGFLQVRKPKTKDRFQHPNQAHDEIFYTELDAYFRISIKAVFSIFNCVTWSR